MTTCSKCGSVSKTTGRPFCSTCGASLVLGGTMPAFAPVPPVRTRTSGMAITGFVLSFFCGLLGLIFSVLGYIECKKSDGKVTGAGLALAGIIVSILSTLTVIFVWIAINRFVEEVKGFGRSTEARIELRSMESRVRQYYYENGTLPKMSVPTPTESCCEQPGERCDADWNLPGWRAINFKVYGSSHFRYGYTSDGNVFTAEAVGDLDCDGDEITYRLTVDTVGGSLDGRIDSPIESD